ncbi:hypothetical protein LguiB_023249 [Lonicera macranthoides]
MAAPSECVKHLESFVDSSSSPAQQAASLDAIANLLKKDMLTLESLVREMEMYLTTTDSIIRARGAVPSRWAEFIVIKWKFRQHGKKIKVLWRFFMMAVAWLVWLERNRRLFEDRWSRSEELWCHAQFLVEDASSSESWQSLYPPPRRTAYTFSIKTSRQCYHTYLNWVLHRKADWKALRGALVGCLALMRRKGNAGMVTGSEAQAVCQSYLQNLQVQSLGQHDRKLCFELIGCLLDFYPDAVVPLGDNLVYGICEAIDGERDPRCLMLTFHIVEALVQLFPDTSGPIGSFAEELFEILGCYFPIHFTHPKGEDVDVKREELARALMLAFASTPLFEPFAVPLLLEKLSSSLPSTKVESMKYLSYCTLKYGPDRMEEHVEALWSSLKDAIYSLSLDSESMDAMHFQENEFATEALTLLQKVIMQNDSPFLNLILDDENINSTINSATSFTNYDDIPLQSKQRLYAVGHILSVSAKASNASCNRVFESLFPRLVDALVISARPNFGALHLCVELLAACRYLVVGTDGLASTIVSNNETWCCLLDRYCSSLIKVFGSTLVTSMDEGTRNAYVHSGVKGLQILATFPGSFSPVSKHTFENILMQLVSKITLDFKKASLWKLVLRSLVEIGLFIDKSQESEKALSFQGIVVEKIVSLLFDDDCTMPLSLQVEAVSEISMTGKDFMLQIVQGLDNAIRASFSRVYVHGDSKSAEFAVQLLECYSYKVLPWFQENGGFEEVAFHFAVNIWDQIRNNSSFTFSFQQKKLLDATMMAVKLAVGGCSEEIQSTVVHKAFSIISSSTSIQMEGLQNTRDLGCFCCRDEWVVSLFASVIIALRPQTKIANVKVIVQLFLATLVHGHVPSAQALGSLVNKLPPKASGVNLSNDFSVEEAIDMIFNSRLMKSCSDGPLMRCSGIDDGSEIGFSGLRLNGLDVQILAIVGLAWMGKGLLMRGHEKLKDVIMIFLSFFMSNGDTGAPSKGSNEQEVLTMMKSTADAFCTLMSDSEDCLNRRFNATVRPLYKQRFFSIVMPLLLSSLANSGASMTRSMLYRAFGHVISDTPLTAILSEAKKLIPIILDGLPVLSEDILNKDIIYNVLLVLSGILMDKKGQEAVLENANIIIRRLIELISYPHMMLIRETAIQCLIAMSELPHATIYPMRTQVLLAISKSLDDPKRAVRQEGVRCRQAWSELLHP